MWHKKTINLPPVAVSCRSVS